MGWLRAFIANARWQITDGIRRIRGTAPPGPEMIPAFDPTLPTGTATYRSRATA
jgi:hypothetical protein